MFERIKGRVQEKRFLLAHNEAFQQCPSRTATQTEEERRKQNVSFSCPKRPVPSQETVMTFTHAPYSQTLAATLGCMACPFKDTAYERVERSFPHPELEDTNVVEIHYEPLEIPQKVDNEQVQ